jgi:hypothetical protein
VKWLLVAPKKLTATPSKPAEQFFHRYKRNAVTVVSANVLTDPVPLVGRYIAVRGIIANARIEEKLGANHNNR